MKKHINIISLIVGVLGLAFGVYAYFSSKQTKEISYNLSSESYKIYDNDLLKESQKISFLKNDSVKIKENVYLTTFSIWNSGDLPINISDIRKDLVLSFKGIEDILDYRVIKEIDQEVSKFYLNQITDTSFMLKWKYFDPRHGIKFQLIYIGNPKLEAWVEGKMLKTCFKEFVFFSKKKDPFIVILSYTIVFCFLTLLFFIDLFTSDNKSFFTKIGEISPKGFNSIIKWFIRIAFVVYLFIICIMFYQNFLGSDKIPF